MKELAKKDKSEVRKMDSKEPSLNETKGTLFVLYLVTYRFLNTVN